MSAVYKAMDIQSGNRHIAIKEMSQGHLSDDELADAICVRSRFTESIVRLVAELEEELLLDTILEDEYELLL